MKSYSTNGSSSITITSNGHHSQSSDTESELSASAVETNELFEQFLQSSVKYMMARGRKTNMITSPATFVKCGERIRGAVNMKLSLLDLVIYEVCVRLCAQSLFFTNAEFYFNLAQDILVNLIGENSVFNLRLKKSSSDKESDPNQRLNSLSTYRYLVEKQTIKNPNLVCGFLTHK